MRIGGVVDISTVDWEGHVSFVIFFAGCNFNCPYCHNPHLIPLDSGYELTIEEIEERLLSHVRLLDSIVVSGGEPLLQPRALEDICLLARKHGLATVIQTNGSKPEVIGDLLSKGLLDCIALDFKTTPENYHLVGGSAPIDAINVIGEYTVDIEIRTTMVKGIVSAEDIPVMKIMVPDGVKWRLQEEVTR